MLKIKGNDVVRLRAGGPNMLAVTGEAGGFVVCATVERGRVETISLASSALVVVLGVDQVAVSTDAQEAA